MVSVIYEFDEFEIDTARFELRRGGDLCHVEPQVFDVLRYLVEHRDRVVAKEELLDNVWGDRFVSESALTSRVKAARQAVGDNGREQRVISTAHGRGYRFVAPIAERDTPVPTNGHRRDIRYARSGSVNIAYEVTGGGLIDIVFVPGFVSHLEIDWEDPRSAAFLERLGRSGRLIRFDKRGTGLSDRPLGLPDLEARMDDVRAVMDAAGSTRAVLIGDTEGGPMAALFAATYPARTQGLVLYGTYAKRVRSEDYPWAPTLEERLEFAASTESEWGIASNMRLMCPNADAEMAEWWQRRARAAASPGAVRALIDMNSRIDVRDVLPTVRVPTLVVHRRDDLQVSIEDGRFLAATIANARLVELPGVDHVPWIDGEQVLEPIEAFLAETPRTPVVPVDDSERALATTLFTDIVGSTDLNASMGDARWTALLDRHDQIMREVIEAWEGRFVKSTGDGVLAVFETPTRALRAARVSHDRLALLGITIRGGVHTSEIETRGSDVAGLGVTIAARLLALAEPDEVLVTTTVRELAQGSGIEFEARGEQVLKGVPGTWVVHAVAHASAPAVHTATSENMAGPPRRRGNIPQLTDPFLGRDVDMQRLTAAVAQSRFLTLAGPGGVGKTRLAIEYARGAALESWFVDLSRVTEHCAVARAFLDTLSISPRQDVNDRERLVEALESRSVLLVVDNCEQVVDAVAEIASRIERETQSVRILATSRQALNVTAEQVLVLTPLGLPDETASDSEQRAADAVQMFFERAQQSGALVDDLASVVALCRRLDGIPLAIELAAARMRAFSAAQILEQLDSGWSVSVARRDHGPAHHLSLDDAIDWSFRLLDEGERDLLLTLSVFRGAFDLAAATAVSGCDAATTADRLAQLVDRSLVQSATGPAGRRFRLLETVRAFMLGRIDPEVVETARERHCAYFAREVAELGALVPGPDEDAAAARLDVDFGDVSAAFAFAADRDDVETAAVLASGPRLSVSTEGARWAQLALRAVELPGADKLPAYVSLLAAAAWAAVVIGDLPRACALAEEGINIVGDPSQHPRLCWIWPQATGGPFSEGADGCIAGAATAAAVGDPGAESFLLGTASIYRLAAGDEPAAVEHAQLALELARRIGSRSLQARAAGALSYALQDIDAPAARRAAEEVLEIAAPGDFHLSMPHRVLAILAWRDGDHETAAEHAMHAAYLIRDQGDRYVQATAIRQLAVLLGSVDAPLAAELLGIADSLVPQARVSARDAAAGTQLRTALREALGTDGYEECVERGRRADAAVMYGTVDRALALMRSD